MAIFYDYYPSPPRKKGEGNPMLHPRPVIVGTIKTEQLARLLSARSTFSSADIKGMLDNLSFGVSDGLSESKNVHLEGLGTFFLSLESRPVEDSSEIRSPSIRVKDIHFRPDKQLISLLNQADIERIKNPRKPDNFTEEDRLARILWYIDHYEGINITSVMHVNSCNYKKANADLDKLLEKGIIRKKYFGNVKVYLRNE